MNAITMPQNSPSEKPASAPSSPPILAAALEYSADGWPVFPCAAATKAPLTPHGFRDASTDPARIRKWWARWPDAMIGLPTGAASGVIVVDLDVDDVKGLNGIAEIERLEAFHGRLPDGPAATTPRGGAHLFFRHDPDRPLRCSTGKIAPGIDVRADGGFVVLAPSIRADGARYEWISPPFADLDFPDLPTWLLDLADRPKAALVPAAPVAGHQPTDLDPRCRAYALAALDREAEAVAATPEGGRNARLNQAAHAVGNFVGVGILDEAEVIEALTAAACEAGLAGNEITKTIRSGLIAGARKEPRWPTEWTEKAAVDAVALNAHLADTGGGAPHQAPIGASWANPDLSILAESRRAPPKFDAEWLGPALAGWVRATAKATSAPADYVAVALLTLAGSVIGNQRRALVGAKWTEPPILFTALVGFPSAGKSPALGAVMSLASEEETRLAGIYREQLVEYEKRKAASEAARSAYKAACRDALRGDAELAKAVPPPMPEGIEEPHRPFLGRVMVQDATVEKLAYIAAGNPKGFLSFHDELAGLFASFGRYSGNGGADRVFWLQAYNGRSHVVDRVKSDEPIRIPHLAVGVLGGIQPDRAAELLAGADDGLPARFLWCWPDPVPGFSVARGMIDDTVAQRTINRLARLGMAPQMAGQPDAPILVPLEEAAIQRVEQIGREMKEREEGASSLMRGALGKVRGTVVRIATILSHLWWAASSRDPFDEPRQICEAAVATAAEMMLGYFVPHAARVFGDAAIPVAETNAATLARHLREKGLPSFNARAVGREMGAPLRAAADMDAACEELVEAGLIRSIGTMKAGRGRKPKDFEVNPAMLRRG
ncbi:DUF3987 domain-containing protein [Xanthobacter aminoxidans]|uniref:DUF3987 domain-containing protein n=1 Tax=Xanthobacter aminoxidans TaxID=186280 RepID=UPI003728B66B